jgi:RNA polymerase primary sigma factor
MSEFHPRMQKIVIRRFGLDGNEPMTLDELGKIYGVTRERIRQFEVKVIKKLREIPRFYNALRDFIY